MEDEKTIGKRIREMRKEKGLTQKALGELCGMSEAQISQYETSYRNPSYKTIFKIAAALDIPKGDLLFGDNFSKDFLHEYFDDLYDNWVYEALAWAEEQKNTPYENPNLDIGLNSFFASDCSDEYIRENLQILVYYFLMLNSEGKRILLEYLSKLQKNSKYIK